MHEGAERTQEVHELDLGNLYVLDRYWAMGSCPHLFSVNSNGDVRYLGEIFTGPPGISRVESLVVDQVADRLVVAELEDERTLIHSASQGATVLAESVLLEKGDYLVMCIGGTDPVEITGQYELLCCPPVHAQKNVARVQSLVQSFAGNLAEGNISKGQFLVSRGNVLLSV